MSTSEPEKPRRRRRRKAPDDEPARQEPDAQADDERTRAGASPEASAESPPEKPKAPRRRRPAEPAAEEPKAAEEEPAAEEEVEEAPPAEPAPAPRRAPRARPAGPPPVVRAQAKYVRTSSRKARLVCDHIRGKSVEDARAILAHTPRAVAQEWSKLLESAVANAENNHELVGEDLYITGIHADQGPTIKRFRPRAMGRATRIRKRTSHLTILLTPKE